MGESLYDFCIRKGRQELLEQWCETDNLPLTPENISYGSKKMVWWKCDKGHKWQTAVYTRTGAETKCPICSGRLVQSGTNDLATLYPHLARQWHPEKNEGFSPEMVRPGSHRMAWWICSKGHEWRAQVKSRVAGCGCPVCANREIHPSENSLASQFPVLAAQWHTRLNDGLTPEKVAPGSRRKVWWRCEKGHEWQASIASRTSGGSGCPVCTGKMVLPGVNDLGSQFPEVAAQWHPTKNGLLTPRQVTSYSNRKIWWKCENGHDYQAWVSSRTMRGCGCPYCSGKRVLPGFNDLATLFPKLAGQWHPTLNGTLKPDMVTTGSRRKVWWQCEQGHVWKAVIYSRTGAQKCGCPVCSGRVSLKRKKRYEILQQKLGV